MKLSGYLAPCMVPRGSSCHGCPLWPFSLQIWTMREYRVCGRQLAWGCAIPSSHRPNPTTIRLLDAWWRKLCHGPGRLLKRTTRTAYLTAPVWWDMCKRLPDMPAVSCETEGKPAASLCLRFLIKWGCGQTLSLVTSKILFPWSSRILDPSVPSPCWDEGKPDFRWLCSHTEVLVKYCSRFVNLVCSCLPRASLVSYTPSLHHKLIRMATCWLLFYSGANSITFLQNVTLTVLTLLIHQPVTNNWTIVFSLLLFWTTGFCIWLSDEWWGAPPRSVFYAWPFLFFCCEEHSEKSRWFILSCGRQSKVWGFRFLLLSVQDLKWQVLDQNIED